MAENKCEGCICIGCRFKDTDGCFHTEMCIDCAKEYTTMLCPGWKKRSRKTMAENKMELDKLVQKYLIQMRYLKAAWEAHKRERGAQ